MRVDVKHALGFRNLVEFFVGFGSEVGLQMDDGGGLVLWYGPHVVAEYPRRRAPEGIIRFVLNTELLSMALECVQHKDSLALEWSGRDTVLIQLTHPSGRSTDVEFPILSMTDERPPRVTGVPPTERRISASTFSNIVHRFAENAVCSSIRIAFFKDGIEFKTEGNTTRFKMRTWHPTHPHGDTATVVVPTQVLSKLAPLRNVNSIMSLGIGPSSALITSKNQDGCLVCVTILVGDECDDPELGNAAQSRPTRV